MLTWHGTYTHGDTTFTEFNVIELGDNPLTGPAIYNITMQGLPDEGITVIYGGNTTTFNGVDLVYGSFVHGGTTLYTQTSSTPIHNGDVVQVTQIYNTAGYAVSESDAETVNIWATQLTFNTDLSVYPTDSNPGPRPDPNLAGLMTVPNVQFVIPGSTSLRSDDRPIKYVASQDYRFISSVTEVKLRENSEDRYPEDGDEAVDVKYDFLNDESFILPEGTIVKQATNSYDTSAYELLDNTLGISFSKLYTKANAANQSHEFYLQFHHPMYGGDDTPYAKLRVVADCYVPDTTISTTEPESAFVGDQWFNPETNELKVYTEDE